MTLAGHRLGRPRLYRGPFGSAARVSSQGGFSKPEYSAFMSNLGSDNLELLPTYIIPKGVATRQEQPQPSQCPF